MGLGYSEYTIFDMSLPQTGFRPFNLSSSKRILEEQIPPRAERAIEKRVESVEINSIT